MLHIWYINQYHANHLPLSATQTALMCHALKVMGLEYVVAQRCGSTANLNL